MINWRWSLTLINMKVSSYFGSMWCYIWASPHHNSLVIYHEKFGCRTSSLSCFYPHFLMTVLVKISISTSLPICLSVGWNHGWPCYWILGNKSRPSFKGAARHSADPMTGNNIHPYCFGIHGSLHGHHYCFWWADCRILEGPTNSSACHVVISL